MTIRRALTAAGVLLFLVSIAGNVVLGRLLWTTQEDYVRLSRQFVKTRDELKRVTADLAKSGGAPGGGSPGAAAPTAVTTATAPAAGKTAVTATAPASPQTAAPSPTAPAGSGSTENALRAKYQQRLGAVQATCEGQLNDLLAQAKAEYDAAKKSGTVDVAALGARYLAKSDGLRRQCDRQVEAEIGALSGELRSAGLPQDLVGEVREAYEARIAERQAEIMAKAPGR